MLTIPFHEILYSALEEDGLSDREFEKILIENGVDNIGYRRISEYKNGATTPPYSKAKTIIDNQLLFVLYYTRVRQPAAKESL